jgi:hypothetical protein
MAAWCSDPTIPVEAVQEMIAAGPPLPGGVNFRVCDGGQQERSVLETMKESNFFEGLMEDPHNYPGCLLYSSMGLTNEEKTMVWPALIDMKIS